MKEFAQAIDLISEKRNRLYALQTTLCAVIQKLGEISYDAPYVDELEDILDIAKSIKAQVDMLREDIHRAERRELINDLVQEEIKDVIGDMIEE